MGLFLGVWVATMVTSAPPGAGQGKVTVSLDDNLKIFLDSQKPAAERQKALGALVKSQEERFIKPLTAEYPHLDGTLKQTVAAGLKDLGATRYFAKMLQDPDDAQRLIAAELVALVPGPEAYDAVLKAAQKDPADKVREYSASALWRFKEPKAVAPLIQILSSDAHPDVRSAAAQSLGYLGGAEALAALESANKTEKDEFVKILIQESIKRAKKVK